MHFHRALAFLFAFCTLSATFPAIAQSIANPQAIPLTGKLPVLFVNGHQNNCGNSSFVSTFGIADEVLKQNGEASLFFNSCSVPGGPSIEKLGAAFGTFVALLKYEDGKPADMVDVVAHSMGGLIVRSYLSGKQEQQGVFAPPPVTHIRKVVFVGTPHFGTPVGALALGFDTQSDELSSGSHFLMDLNTWNQNHDDLRGVDAVAIAGSGGTGLAVMKDFDDGVVALSSASLRFYMPGRTRILPLCHVDGGGLTSLIRLCDSDAKGIAKIRAAGDDNARIITSFLNGANDWQTIGQSAEQNKFLQSGGGLLVRARTNTDFAVNPSSLRTTAADGSSKQLNMSNSEIGYTDFFSSGKLTLTANWDSTSAARQVMLPPGGYAPFIVKSGPAIDGVAPAAAAVFPLVIAPRMIVSIYGTELATATAQAGALPLPAALGGAQVSAGGMRLGLLYASPQQINAVMPDGASGLLKFTVQTSAGVQTANVWVEPAFPAVFTLDQSGSGPAAALNATNSMPITAANPLHALEYLVLYLTGLGATTPKNGLDYAIQQPTVTVAGASCPVSFAGAAPGYVGLDQINCQLPRGLGPRAAAPVIVQLGERRSPVTTIVLQ